MSFDDIKKIVQNLKKNFPKTIICLALLVSLAFACYFFQGYFGKMGEKIADPTPKALAPKRPQLIISNVDAKKIRGSVIKTSGDVDAKIDNVKATDVGQDVISNSSN